MESMKHIYTKTGDFGETSLKGGLRVPKTDIRIEANGQLDELNCVIGIVRAFLENSDVWQLGLKDVQLNLMRIMNMIASLRCSDTIKEVIIDENRIVELEKHIDEMEAKLTPSEYFILPGGSECSSFLHLARATVRNVERTLYRLNENYHIPQNILIYINRLSDLFFVMARYFLQESGISEERWKLFRVKK